MKDKRVDASYRVYVVKRNEGTRVRLCDLNSLLGWIYKKTDDRLEVELVSKEGNIEDFSNELWNKGSIIWYSPLHPRIWEATCEDDQARKEDKLVKEWLDETPDVDPIEQKTNGRLIRVEMSGYSVRDGQKRYAQTIRNITIKD